MSTAITWWIQKKKLQKYSPKMWKLTQFHNWQDATPLTNTWRSNLPLHCFPFLLLISNEHINKHSCWNYTWSSITTLGWLQRRELCKNKESILSESTGYKEFVIKSIAYFIIICMLHTLYFTKIYNTIYVYILQAFLRYFPLSNCQSLRPRPLAKIRFCLIFQNVSGLATSFGELGAGGGEKMNRQSLDART